MGKKLLIAFSILAIGLVTALLWPTASYDISRVHPSIRSLASPYQSVGTSYFLDGGNIGIRIVDRNGKILELALPKGARKGDSYPHLFMGASHTTRPGATEIEFTNDTRRMLISVIERFRTPGDASDTVLVSLRGAPRDYARILQRRVTSFFRASAQ